MNLLAFFFFSCFMIKIENAVACHLFPHYYDKKKKTIGNALLQLQIHQRNTHLTTVNLIY